MTANTSILPTKEVGNPNLLAEAHLHFNEPVIAGWTVCRLIGYAEDSLDCYWILREPGTCVSGDNGKVIWHTCVGGVTFLHRLQQQGIVYSSYNGERWDDLSRLDSALALNGCPHEKEFQLVIRDDGMERYIKHN